MPTYVYECSKCGDELEVWQSFTEDPLKKHGGCGGKLTKVLQPVGIVLKGSGFYKTDNRNGAKTKSSADNGSSSDTSTKSDSKSDTSATKSDSKAATKSAKATTT